MEMIDGRYIKILVVELLILCFVQQKNNIILIELKMITYNYLRKKGGKIVKKLTVKMQVFYHSFPTLVQEICKHLYLSAL